MKIKLMPRVEDIDSGEVKGCNVIVIDMLRATSVITTAMDNGARMVVPVLSVEDAFEMRKKYGKDTVLGGERKGLKIEGFDAGNSPLEYTPEFINDRVLVMTTSNGTRAVNGCTGAENVYIGSMLNGRAAAQKVSLGETDIAIVCAGTLGRFSLDDFICAGYIIDELLNIRKYDMDDVSFLAHHTFIENKDNVEGFISNASHYKYLLSIGLQDDIKYCCKMGIINTVPVFNDGVIS